MHDALYWIPSFYRGEWTCSCGVGHGDHYHGCCGKSCCSRDDYPSPDTSVAAEWFLLFLPNAPRKTRLPAQWIAAYAHQARSAEFSVPIWKLVHHNDLTQSKMQRLLVKLEVAGWLSINHRRGRISVYTLTIPETPNG